MMSKSTSRRNGSTPVDAGTLLKIECIGELLERVRQRNLAPEAMDAAIVMGAQVRIAAAEAPRELREKVGILCRHMDDAKTKHLSPVFVEAAQRVVVELIKLGKAE